MKLTPKKRTAVFYEKSTGERPFQDWLYALKDIVGKAKLAARIERAELGAFGNYRDVGESVLELKDSYGPGYRIYFAIEGDNIILLLMGGTKGSQPRDIAKAKSYLWDYKSRRMR